MHEYALVQSLLESVLQEAQAHGAKRVLRVTIQKGHLSDEVAGACARNTPTSTPNGASKWKKFRPRNLPCASPGKFCRE